MKQHQCEFEMQPKYPRCEEPATDFLVTKPPSGPQMRAKYCAQHRGYIQSLLKGTYVKVVTWGKLNEQGERVYG